MSISIDLKNFDFKINKKERMKEKEIDNIKKKESRKRNAKRPLK